MSIASATANFIWYVSPILTSASAVNALVLPSYSISGCPAGVYEWKYWGFAASQTPFAGWIFVIAIGISVSGKIARFVVTPFWSVKKKPKTSE